MTKIGLNDVSGAVWAMGEFFSSFFLCFWILTKIFFCIYRFNLLNRETNNNENGPKQHGIIWSIGESFFVFFDTKIFFCIYGFNLQNT